MKDEEIEIINDVESSVVENNNSESSNTISNEVKEETIVETPSVDNTNDAEFNVIMNEPTTSNDKTEDVSNDIKTVEVDQINNNEVSTNIVPDTNVAPQEIVTESITESVEAPKEDAVVESSNNVEVNNETNSTEQVINANVDEIPTPVNNVNNTNSETVVQNDNNTSNNEEVINIKETSTIQNEAGTSVIGEINGDNVTAVNATMPNSIDVNATNNQVEIESKKKVTIKTKNNKLTSIIIVILVLAVLGVGGYYGYDYYLNNMATPSFEVKNVSVEYGEPIPTNASYYVESSKEVDDMAYTVDISGVGENIGSYTYTVTRNGQAKTGTITISDTKGPVVTFKENLMFAKNTPITKELLVSSCEDRSNCTYDISGNIDTTLAGSQEVVIYAKDDNGNTTEATTNISIIGKSLVCKSDETLSADGTYNERLEDVFYFDDEEKYISSVGKKVVTFIDYGSYFTLLNNEETKDKYNFDRKTFSYWIPNDILYKEGTSLTDIQAYYTSNNYTCQ